MQAASMVPESRPAEGDLSDRLFRVAVIGLFFIAGAVRVINVWRPVDGNIRDGWREPDVAGIARNFYREGMNIFYPRIDWRGDGPGFVESEFPLYAWTAACLYRLFGYHEEFLRAMSFVLSLASCIVFFRLASILLSRAAALAAFAVFALNPVAVRMASAIQPEPLMFWAYLLAVYYFHRWCGEGRTLHYSLALAATSLAILAKLPAAHLGLLFAMMCFQQFGVRAFVRRDLWVFACGSLALPIWWYWHAHTLYQEFGHSLGMSNEAYGRIYSMSFLEAVATTVPGIVGIEMIFIWMPTGVVLGLLGLWVCFKDRKTRLVVFWFATLAVFYFVTGRTTGAGWATHYHVVGVPVAALSIGAGIDAVMRKLTSFDAWRFYVPLALALAVAIAVVVSVPVELTPTPTRIVLAAGLFAVSLAIFFGVLTGLLMLIPGAVRFSFANLQSSRSPRPALVLYALLAVLIGLFPATLASGMYLVRREMHWVKYAELYQTAIAFREHLPPGALIVATGPDGKDEYGLEQATNAPYMFFWTDRKGFTLAESDLTIDKLEGLRRRGARFLIAERAHLSSRPEFEKGLKDRYGVVDERENAILLRLTLK